MMKKYLIIILLATLFSAQCKKEEREAKILVTVVTPSKVKVQDATVRVYCIMPDCIINDIKTTDADGQTIHGFDLEAVLVIEATKVESGDTLNGTGIADLEKGETITVTVEID